jgi:hypothetical protein
LDRVDDVRADRLDSFQGETDKHGPHRFIPGIKSTVG